jgi:ubiquinone/menaquinone biosynthesis C-methylase UbiE
MGDEPELLWSGSMAESYEKYFTPILFRPFAADLARRAATTGARQILELAAGTGVVTRALAEAMPGTSITATDINPTMIAEGSLRAPSAKWQQADAMTLPFDDGQFDLVVCQFGIMFFPEKPTAFAEARRVLRPGAPFLTNSWGTVAEHGFAAALAEVLDELLPGGSPTFMEDIPHGYNDPAQIRADFEAGGFTDIAIEPIALEGTAESAEHVARAYAFGSPLRPDLEAAGDLEEITQQMAAGFARCLGDGEVRAAMHALVITAR